MNITKRLEDFLDRNGITYGRIAHHRAHTATTTALAERVPTAQQAKVVIVKADDANVMAVLPANRRLSVPKLQGALGAKAVRIALEEEIYDLFEDCELGAMPPFGNLYGMPVWMDPEVARESVIVFNAGTHRDAIRMRTADYQRIVKPSVADISIEGL
jgi:Ala-tRNA(Pro) deacylase